MGSSSLVSKVDFVMDNMKTFNVMDNMIIVMDNMIIVMDNMILIWSSKPKIYSLISGGRHSVHHRGCPG